MIGYVWGKEQKHQLHTNNVQQHCSIPYSLSNLFAANYYVYHVLMYSLLFIVRFGKLTLMRDYGDKQACLFVDTLILIR